jgi:hypothetical protein
LLNRTYRKPDLRSIEVERGLEPGLLEPGLLEPGLLQILESLSISMRNMFDETKSTGSHSN